MPLVPATGPLLTQILDQSHAIWGEGLSRRAYEQYNLAQVATRWGRQTLQRVALVEGGRVLSSAKRYDFELVIDGRTCRTLGIGAVFTPPDLRGRGHGRELLRELIEQAREEGFAAALLFSEIGTDYYAQAGFSAVPRDTLRLNVARQAGSPGVVVRAGDPRDLPAIGAMDEELGAFYRVRLCRSPEWIDYSLTRKRLLAGLGPPGARELLFFVVEEGGRAVAYAVIAAAGAGWSLEACGDRDPSGARVGAILQTLVARDPARPAPPLAGWLPEGWLPPQLSIASRAAAEQVMMIRPLTEAGRIDPPPRHADVHWWHGDAF